MSNRAQNKARNMILPHPESDLSINIMVLGAEIIKTLKGHDFILIEDLMVSFLQNNKKRTPDMFLNTLTFLFACGLIDRRKYKVKLIIHKPTQRELF